jgi:N-acetyl-anhydromuramyl-L-alanine amidase AmpD
MIDIISYGKLKSCGKQKKKKQIILCHTSREVGEYLTSLEFRYSSGYGKIPNYLVDRSGKVYKLLDDEEYGKIFEVENINRNSIIICLENLGWLEKKPLSNDYINWIGNIYNGEIYQKKWRDYIFWQPYTEQQIDNTVELCKELLKTHKIPDFVVTHNTKLENVDRIRGIVSRSNFDTYHTDLNPSFDFENFQKKIKNG